MLHTVHVQKQDHVDRYLHVELSGRCIIFPAYRFETNTIWDPVVIPNICRLTITNLHYQAQLKNLTALLGHLSFSCCMHAAMKICYNIWHSGRINAMMIKSLEYSMRA
jgi:hypothetical protein